MGVKSYESVEGGVEWDGTRVYPTHLEGLALTCEHTLDEIARNVFGRDDVIDPVARAQWESLAGNGRADQAFQDAYVAFVSNGGALALKSPEQYDFIKRSVFAGDEFKGIGTAEQVERGVAALGTMESLRPAAWERMTVGERLTTLQAVEDRLAAVEGRPSVPVVSANLGPASYGQYDYRRICVSAERLAGGDIAGLVNVVAHEGRHCYQHFAVWYPWLHTNAAEVAVWSVNFRPGNYLTADRYGYEAYRNQPIERDAWAFGEAIRDGLYGPPRKTS